VRHNPGCPVPWGSEGFWGTFEIQILFAVSLPVSTLKCTLIGHVGFQPLTMDSRSNPTPEGFKPLTKSSRRNSPTNCTLWQRKRYPDGLIKKLKARFCACRDQQLEGIDFFETYAPVVQWTTIHLMFILEILLGLKSMQGDVTCAFLHADLEENEVVYLDMPMEFAQYVKNGKKKCLKLKKTLYRL
jgi:hypothetical protein